MGNPVPISAPAPNPAPVAKPVAPVPASAAIPSITVFSATSQEAEESDSDSEVKTLTIPFRSASGNFLPMITTEDKWITELEFRFKIILNIFRYIKYINLPWLRIVGSHCFFEPLEGLDFFDVHLDKNESGFLSWNSALIVGLLLY